MTVKISLNSRKNKGLFAIVDESDADMAEITWHTHNQKYAKHTVNVDGDVIAVFMHRLILERVLGRTLVEEECVDHRDGNGFNNIRSNLRLTTRLGNAWNRGISSLNTTGYKGIYRVKNSDRWAAHIRVKGAKLHLGYFNSAEEAAKAYNDAAIEHFGDFARLNVMPEETS